MWFLLKFNMIIIGLYPIVLLFVSDRQFGFMLQICVFSHNGVGWTSGKKSKWHIWSCSNLFIASAGLAICIEIIKNGL